jgi:hypothetical protein
MYATETRTVNLTLATFMLLLVVSQVRGQTVSEITVGTAAIIPRIDGQWEQGEWDDAIEYTLTVFVGSPTSVEIPAYIRMVHDSHNLFGIIDVPTDNGTAYVNANGNRTWGAALLSFYYGAFLNPYNQTQLFTFFALNTNQTEIANVSVYCLCVHGVDANMISSDSHAATTLSVTPHSSSKHRVWEFSLPIYPYVITTSLDTNPMISFDVTVIDSSGNHISLVNGSTQHASLTFVSISVPEVPSGQMILPVSLITPLILLLAYRRKRAR